MPTTLDSYFPFSAGAGASVSEAQWRQMARLWHDTGVVAAALSGLNELAVAQRAAGANMSVDVATGWAWVLGTFGASDSVKNLPIAANASGNPRIDTVVVRADFVNDRVELDVLQGTPAGSPVAPALTQSSSVWEIALGNVAVADGAASIATANITDRRSIHGAPAPPAGLMMAYAGAAAPAGYLLCDGAAVSRTTYASLFTAIGTVYGVGDGSTTFNLPNLKGKVPVGLDAAQTEFDALGETGGAKTVTLASGEIPAHDHAVHATLNSPGAWVSGTDSMATVGGLGGTGVTSLIDVQPNTGGGGAHQNLQPYVVANWIIKT